MNDAACASYKFGGTLILSTGSHRCHDTFFDIVLHPDDEEEFGEQLSFHPAAMEKFLGHNAEHNARKRLGAQSFKRLQKVKRVTLRSNKFVVAGDDEPRVRVVVWKLHLEAANHAAAEGEADEGEHRADEQVDEADDQ
jgi:hypothetical protein